MNFTQLPFFVLTAITLLVVVTTQNMRLRKIAILLASLVFYGWWDWRFIGLVLISTTIDFLTGLLVESARRNDDMATAKLGITIAIAANLAILGVFKYFDFFSSSAVLLLNKFALNVNPVLLNVILPIGISFYTFHAISYAVDVYRGDTKASRNYLDYLNFVMFFPQLVAGPIARASHLLPQVTAGFKVSRENFYSGSQLFFFGLLKKLLIADLVGPIVDRGFATPQPWFVDAIFCGLGFMCQIYGDFSGYTDMARGTARMFGIALSDNFYFPFLVDNPRDFWRNWHISLSSWLRDYLFIPIGGSFGPFWFVARNLMITMVLGGLWHGASWNFVLWGSYHGALLVIHRWWSQRGIGEWLSAAWGANRYRIAAWIVFTILMVIGWILFRSSQSALQLERLLHALTTPRLKHTMTFAEIGWVIAAFATVCGLQLWQKRNGPEPWHAWGFSVRTAAYAASLIALAWFTADQSNPFIYFQF